MILTIGVVYAVLFGTGAAYTAVQPDTLGLLYIATLPVCIIGFAASIAFLLRKNIGRIILILLAYVVNVALALAIAIFAISLFTVPMMVFLVLLSLFLPINLIRIAAIASVFIWNIFAIRTLKTDTIKSLFR